MFESTPNVENEADEIQTGGSEPHEISIQTSALRMRRGGVTMRGACVTEALSCESGSNSSNKLRTINGKIVRMRWKRRWIKRLYVSWWKKTYRIWYFLGSS
ncbi:hypothetical protein Tco_0900865 [Tanacetum coccineum]